MHSPHGHRSRFHVITALATAVALVGCGGGTSNEDADPTDTTIESTDTTNTTDAPETTDTTTPSEPLATVIRIDAAVDARIDTASDFTAIDQPAGVNPGDQVRTDSSGFAEITYFDGSTTRLDIDTDFTVVDLSDDAGVSTIRTTMGTGRTWHRVQELTGDDTYEVTTSVATATVRGTGFVITCPDDTTCDFTVLDGTVEITPLDGEPITVEANETITITADQTPDPSGPIDPDLLADPWIVRNESLDTDTGWEALDTITNGGGQGEFAASPEFCAKWKSGLTGIFIVNSAETLVEAYREYTSELLALAPDELKPTVQQLLDIEIDPNDVPAASAQATPIVADIDAFVADNCAPVVRPTFTFVSSQQAGFEWVLFADGECPDGSFPVDVAGPPPLFGEPVPATDLGNGSYSFEYSPTGEYTEANLLAELYFPEGISGVCP